MTTAIREDWPDPVRDDAPRLTEVARPPRRLPGWTMLAIFPVAVALTVFAMGGADGRAPGAVRVDVRDSSGDLAAAGRLADRLTAAGMSIVTLRPAARADGALRRTEIRYVGDSERSLARAMEVRRAVGRGTIVRSSGAPRGVDVILVIGKDVQNE